MDTHALNRSIKEEEARAVKAADLFLSMNNFIVLLGLSNWQGLWDNSASDLE